MNFRLVCDEKNRNVVIEKLRIVNAVFSSEAEFFLVEESFPVPENSISIIFSMHNINRLLVLLIEMQKNNLNLKNNEVIPVIDGESMKLIKTREIIFFYTEKSRIFVQTHSGYFETKKRLFEIETELKSAGFIRISKTHVVNILQIHEIQPWFGGNLLLKFIDFPDEAEISRRYVPAFKDYLNL